MKDRNRELVPGTTANQDFHRALWQQGKHKWIQHNYFILQTRHPTNFRSSQSSFRPAWYQPRAPTHPTESSTADGSSLPRGTALHEKWTVVIRTMGSWNVRFISSISPSPSSALHHPAHPAHTPGWCLQLPQRTGWWSRKPTDSNRADTPFICSSGFKDMTLYVRRMEMSA